METRRLTKSTTIHGDNYKTTSLKSGSLVAVKKQIRERGRDLYVVRSECGAVGIIAKAKLNKISILVGDWSDRV